MPVSSGLHFKDTSKGKETGSSCSAGGKSMAGRCVGVLCRRSCSSTAAPVIGQQAKPSFWERMKEKKFVVWTKSLLHDYAEACKDAVVGAKERPGKAALYISILAGVGICSSKAPSEDSFYSSMLEASSSLLLLSPWTRSGRSDQHIQRLMELKNQERLRHINLSIFSLIYEAPCDPHCDLYSTQCPHLLPRWSEFPSRVLDVGFFGRWWLLQEKMKDFDINEEEFAHLPAHLRTISYDDLHSDKRDKLYERKLEHVTRLEDTIKEHEISMESLKGKVMPRDSLTGKVSPEDFLNMKGTSEESIKERVRLEESLKEKVTLEESLKEKVTLEESLKEKVTLEESLKEKVTLEESLKEKVTLGESLKEKVTSEESLKKRVTFEILLKQKVTVEDSSTENITLENSQKENIMSGDTLEEDKTHQRMT